MLKKIFTLKIALFVIVIDTLILLVTPWRYFQVSNGYCAEDWPNGGGPLGLMVCEYNLSPFGEALFLVCGFILVVFVGHLIVVGIKKLVSMDRPM